MEGEEWTVVKSNRPMKKPSAVVVGSSGGTSSKSKKKQSPHLVNTSSTLLRDEEHGKSVDQLQQEVLTTMKKLRTTAYYQAILRSISCTLSPSVTICKIVALGIGSVAQSNNSNWQFALLVMLSQDLNVEMNRATEVHSISITEKYEKGIRIEYFDPIATVVDEQLCERFHIDLLRTNNKGLFPDSSSSSSSPQDKVIYYMPHCPYRLYCNVLWSHWHTLDDVCILGNSFESYSLRRIHINPSSKVDANMSKNQMNKKSKQSKKKGSSEEVVEGMHTEAVVEDRTDLVMQLLPFIRERKMWPLSAILSGNHSVEASTVQRREADKEHHHCLEGAFSELSWMQFDSSAIADTLRMQWQNMLAARPSEEDMLLATSTDVEIF